MNKFSIEKLQYPEELDNLYSFFRKAYSPKHILLNKEFFEWQFKNQNFLNIILKENNEIKGHVGLIGKDYIYNDKNIRCSFLSCLIVAEELRGRGAGAYLAREAAKDHDVLYATGINKDGMSSFFALGWTDAKNLYRWVRINPFLKYETRALEIRRFNGDWNRSWKILRKRYPLTINRTLAYLNWRFVNHPKIQYKIFGLKNNNIYDGYIVARLEEGDRRAVRIVDLIVKDKDAEVELLKAALSYAAEQKVDFIDFFCSSRIYEKSLNELEFSGPESPEVGETPIFILPLDANRKSINWAYKIINPKLQNIKKEDWFIIKADGDKDRPV